MIDWGALWRKQIAASQRIETCRSDFWDRRADRDEAGRGLMADLTARQLAIIRIRPGESLLEIGPGSGRLTVPLAAVAGRVTAVEPSRNMRRLLRKHAAAAGTGNIRCLGRRWEDLRLGRDVARHDVVLSSFSLLVSDIRAALAKIDAAARRAAYVFQSADDWMPPDIRALAGRGRSRPWHSDHLIAYGLLQEMGLPACAETWRHESRRLFRSREDAAAEMETVYAVPAARRRALREHLAAVLVETEGGFLYVRKKRAAAIWWFKEP